MNENNKIAYCYFKRLLVILPVVLCFSVTVFYLSPLELVSSDPEGIIFTLNSAVLWMGLFTVLNTVLISSLVAVLSGKAFNIIVSCFLSAGIGVYIESAFMSAFLPPLDGNTVPWEFMFLVMFLDLLIWLVLYIAVFLLLKYKFELWKKGVRYVSFLLVIMQLAGVVSVIVSAPPEKETALQMTADEMYDFSNEENVVVFILDRLDYEYVEEVIADDPSFFDELDGFTSYANAMAPFGRTKPAASALLSGNTEDAYMIPREQYYDKQWEGYNLLKQLADKGYRVNLYGANSGLVGTGKNLEGAVTNLRSPNGDVDGFSLIYNLAKISTYRCAPYILKPYLWTYSSYINDGVIDELDIDESAFNSVDYSLNFTDNKYFKFYHFSGSHPPYDLDETGAPSEAETDRLTKTKGSFQLVFNILNEMKKNGSYENSTIFILADHGCIYTDTAELPGAVSIGLFFKPKGAVGEPLKTSDAPVTHENVRNSIMKETGIEYDGEALDEVPEDAERVRYFYKTIVEGVHESKLVIYKVVGDAKNFDNWTKISEVDISGYFY